MSLSRFKFWRRMRGGLWTLIGPSPAMPALGFMWVRGAPLKYERIYDCEDWS